MRRNIGRKMRARFTQTEKFKLFESVEYVIPHLDINQLKILNRVIDEWITKKKTAILQK